MAHQVILEEAAAGRLMREVQDHCLKLRGLSSRDLGGLRIAPIFDEVMRFAMLNDLGELTSAQVCRLLHIQVQLCGASAYMANCAWQRAVRFAEAMDSRHAAKAGEQKAAARHAAKAGEEKAAAAAAAPAEEVVQQNSQPHLPAVAAASPLSAGKPANEAAAPAPKLLVPRPPAWPPPAVSAGRLADADAAAAKPLGPRPPAGPPPEASQRQGPYSRAFNA